MVAVSPPKMEDRRKNNTQVALDKRAVQPDVQSRIHDELRTTASNHDLPWKKADPELWLNNYLLLKHLDDAGNMLVAMGTDDGELAIRRMLGNHHDIGKAFEPYSSLYRLNRDFTSSEYKIMQGHARRGKEYVLELSRKVRREDRQIFHYVATAIEHHHAPWRIFPTWLRKITWDLNIMDGFLAGLEKRHDGSKSIVESLDSAHEKVKELPRLVRLTMGKEIRSSLESLDRVVMAGTFL